jgi:hypothetical protein
MAAWPSEIPPSFEGTHGVQKNLKSVVAQLYHRSMQKCHCWEASATCYENCLRGKMGHAWFPNELVVYFQAERDGHSLLFDCSYSSFR